MEREEIEFYNICKTINGIEIIKNLSVHLPKGEIVGIVAPNGCGKTTLLNIIAGIEKTDSGKITVGPNTKSVGFLFQDYYNYLLPWKNVADNIVFPLKLNNISRTEQQTQLNHLLKNTNLKNFSLENYPYELSGGQNQFVSLLRCLVNKNDSLFLDEPFSSLDYTRRKHAQNLVTEYWQKHKPTIFFVTQDLSEAILMSTAILVFKRRPLDSSYLYIKNALPRPRNAKSLNTEIFQNTLNTILNFLSSKV